MNPPPKRRGGDYRPNPDSSADAPSGSQLIPMASWQGVVAKPYFWPGVAVALLTVVMFGYVGDARSGITVSLRGLPIVIPMSYWLVAFLILGATGWALHKMAGRRQPLWLIQAVVIFAAVTTHSPLIDPVLELFRQFAPKSSDNLMLACTGTRGTRR